MSRRQPAARRYHPGLLYGVVGLGAIAWLVFALQRPGDVGILGLVAPVGMLLFLIGGWRVYTVDEEGLRVRDLLKGRFAPWTALGGVTARQYEGHQPRTGIPHAGTTTFFYVRDEHGRVFATVGSWIGKRHELIAEIRTRIRHARED